MKAVDAEVLQQLKSWLDRGLHCWLATVVETWGSSPRPVGSLFACNEKSQIVGSLSGGCVEDDLLEKLTNKELAHEQAQHFDYGITPEETERLGLPCGGHLSIVVESIPSNQQQRSQADLLVTQLTARKSVQRIVDLNHQKTTISIVDQHQPLSWQPDKRLLKATYGPRNQLFIIGAGMVSKYLADMASNLDFQVTVCDPRKHLLDDFGVKGVKLVADMPDDAVRAMAADNNSAIVALTHDPRIDDMGLMEALTTKAFYVGAMGSTRTSVARRERLKALDLSETEVDRLHAPIGLSIGSKTPPEIAIAILAEIVAVQRGAAQSRSNLNPTQQSVAT